MGALEQLYSNPVLQQTDLLERELGVRLFLRSPQGLTLTPAGELIYTEAKKLIQHSNTVLRKARALERPKETVIRVGVSLMNPANTLLELWARASERFPSIRLEVVPYEDTVPAFLEVLDHMGEKIDLISCPYTTTYWGDRAEPPPDSNDRGGLSRHGHLQSVGVLRAAAGVGLLLDPLLATIPLECGYTMPYGLIYAKEPSKEVMQFVAAVEQLNSNP